jgi:HAD superfamily phosphoserine phosphatase-like hydrolase
MKKIICFDVSGTLVDQNSWDIFTSSEEIEKKLKDIFDDYNNNKIPLRDFWDQVALVFKSTGNVNIEYIRNHFDDANVLKEGAEDLINYLKEKGYKIYLISCSIDIYLEELTRKLKLDGFFAGTKFIFDENGELLSIENECFENKNFKEEKVTYSNFLGNIIASSVWVIAILAILYQLQIAQTLILIAFIGFITLIVLTVGIAFGLGGKEIAKKTLEDIEKKIK